MAVNFALYRGRELVSDTSSTYADYVRDAADKGFQWIYHYSAMPMGVKGIESHIALCSFAGSEIDPSKLGNESTSANVASPAPEAAKNTRLFDSSSGLPVTTSEGDAKLQSPPSPIALDQNSQILPSSSTPE